MTILDTVICNDSQILLNSAEAATTYLNVHNIGELTPVGDHLKVINRIVKESRITKEFKVKGAKKLKDSMKGIYGKASIQANEYTVLYNEVQELVNSLPHPLSCEGLYEHLGDVGIIWRYQRMRALFYRNTELALYIDYTHRVQSVVNKVQLIGLSKGEYDIETGSKTNICHYTFSFK